MANLLLQDIDYQITRTPLGTWRRYVYDGGQRFAEFRSRRKIAGLPLVHYTYGRCPETGRRIVAKGVLAVGRLAVGVFAVGQASLGLFAVGQLALGVFLGLGQAATGVAAVGQLAIGAQFGLGQLATGVVAIGQVAYGRYVLAQIAFGEHVWMARRVDPEAVRFFEHLLPFLRGG